MAQGSYKTLIWKLSGAALGLVIMLSVATTMSQNIVSKEDKFTSFDAEYSQNEQEFKRALNEEFKIVVESGVQALKESSLAIENLEADKLKNLMVLKADTIEAISEAMAEVAVRVTIPEDVKENLLADLELQLAKNEKTLSELEHRVLDFSYKMILPKLSSYNSSNCSQSDVIVEKKSGQKTQDSNTKGGQKNATEAFYWI